MDEKKLMVQMNGRTVQQIVDQFGGGDDGGANESDAVKRLRHLAAVTNSPARREMLLHRANARAEYESWPSDIRVALDYGIIERDLAREIVATRSVAKYENTTNAVQPLQSSNSR